MGNENDVDTVDTIARAVRMRDAIPDVSLRLGNGKTVRGKYKPPDKSHVPPETEHLFATNSGILVSDEDPKMLAKRMEAALRKNEEEQKKRKKAKKTR